MAELVGFAKQRALVKAPAEQIFAEHKSLQLSKQDLTLFPEEFLLEVSSQACEGLDRAEALGRPEAPEPEPEQSSSSAEEEDEGADEAEPEPLAALWMRGGRKSVADLVGTPAAQLQPSAQLCGWLQLEGKKAFRRLWCVLINLDAVGVPGKGRPPDRIILYYASADATEAEGSIFLRAGNYQVRPPKTQRSQSANRIASAASVSVATLQKRMLSGTYPHRERSRQRRPS